MKSIDTGMIRNYVKSKRWYIPNFIIEIVLDEEEIYLARQGLIIGLSEDDMIRFSFFDYLFGKVWPRRYKG